MLVRKVKIGGIEKVAIILDMDEAQVLRSIMGVTPSGNDAAHALWRTTFGLWKGLKDIGFSKWELPDHEIVQPMIVKRRT